MGWLDRSHSPVVGVDLEGRFLRAVQASRTPEGWRVEAAAEVERPDSAAAVGVDDLALLLEVMDRQGFAPVELVVGVPTPDTFSEVLELPPRASGAPLEQLAKMEVARIRRCDPEAFELACWDLPAARRVGDSTHMLGVGCDHESADALLDLFEGAGARVRALDVRACALARAAGPMPPGLTAIVELGWERARLVAVLDGVILYERRIEEAGLREARRAVQEQLDVDEDVADLLLESRGLDVDPELSSECLAIVESTWEGALEEINASLSYAEHRYTGGDFGRLMVAGPGAALAPTLALLGTMLGMEPSPLTPDSRADCWRIDATLASSPAMAAALGLAMWES